RLGARLLVGSVGVVHPVRGRCVARGGTAGGPPGLRDSETPRHSTTPAPRLSARSLRSVGRDGGGDVPSIKKMQTLAGRRAEARRLHATTFRPPRSCPPRSCKNKAGGGLRLDRHSGCAPLAVPDGAKRSCLGWAGGRVRWRGVSESRRPGGPRATENRATGAHGCAQGASPPSHPTPRPTPPQSQKPPLETRKSRAHPRTALSRPTPSRATLALLAFPGWFAALPAF
ncbi:MAG: hypothetical protein JWO85_2750, partial [Candidatus Eremiobacteraeota bacterium]|nr:hypothetical protein [Candidatus Eremiobacteraeota bacterium]